MKCNVLFLALLFCIPLHAMRAGAQFYAQPVATRSNSSQAGTQPLSQPEELEIEDIHTQTQKDAELDSAINNSNMERTIALLGHGASFPLAVERSVHYHKPEILKKVLSFDKTKDIYCRQPFSALSDKNPVLIACQKAQQTNDMKIVLALLADKRVDVVDYVKKGKANGSMQVCALFLLANQGTLSESDIELASLFIAREGVGLALDDHRNVQKLYNLFPADQHAEIHEMLLQREGTGVDHLVKAAAWGHKYMVARLLVTAPSGPFTQQEFASALYAAQAKGHKDIVQMLENRERLSMFLPIPLCNELNDIKANNRPRMTLYDMINMQSNITPFLARSILNSKQREIAALKLSAMQDVTNQVSAITRKRKCEYADENEKAGKIKKLTHLKDVLGDLR